MLRRLLFGKKHSKKTKPTAIKSTAVPKSASKKSLPKKTRPVKSRPVKREPLLTTKLVKRYLGISQLLAPVLLPILYKGIVSSREFIQNSRAKKLGIPVEKVNTFFGAEAKEKARLYNLENTLSKLAERYESVPSSVKNMQEEITHLNFALQSVSTMSNENKKAALKNITTKINDLEKQILTQLEV